MQIEDQLELNSDHSPIFLTLIGQTITKSTHPCLANRRTKGENFILKELNWQDHWNLMSN